MTTHLSTCLGGLDLNENMKTETFPDGSTIDTDEATGNRTVCGKLAHIEYFKRLRAEQITPETPCAIVSFCTNLDGSRKAELIRKTVSNQQFGPYAWEVWHCDDPANVVRYRDEATARQAFKAAMLHGTNETK